MLGVLMDLRVIDPSIDVDLNSALNLTNGYTLTNVLRPH